MAFRKTIPSMNPDATASEKGIQNLISPGGAATTSTNGTAGTHILAADNVLASDRTMPITAAATQCVIANTGYHVCYSAGNDSAKILTISGFMKAIGKKVTAYFANTNTAIDATLNVSNTGAHFIRHVANTTATDYTIQGGRVYTFVFDGSVWLLVNPNRIYYSTTDLVAGTSPLGTGQIYLVYE